MKRNLHIHEPRRPKRRIKAVNRREADKILRSNGWVYKRSHGDHDIYKHENHAEMISIPRDVNLMMWEKYVKKFNLLNV